MSTQSLIPFGPQHPVFPEPIQLRLVLEDEKVVEALPALGYVHRGLEKIAQQKDILQDVFLVERVCGICSFIHSLTYCRGVETLMGLTVPDRARFLRVVWSEMSRLHSHLLWLGLMADSFGFENLFMQAFRLREKVLDLMEATGGNRVIMSSCCIGGVRRDLTADLVQMVRTTLDEVERELEPIITTMRDDYTVRERTVGIGRLTKEEAHELGAVGPVARGCGIPMDFRTTGYEAYGDLEFKPVVFEGGDCYARCKVRLYEMPQSISLMRGALDKLPAGPLAVPVKGNPDGETISRCEQPRGEVIYYMRANNTRNLERLRIRTPTFANLAPLLKMLPGCQLADVPVIVLAIDPCISCTER
ncbi:MAG TPA: nickel-dependent hydrogenase large subunit [Candidatus Ozemobacteraceae bacterium]|nr:nickel-dependent hydrogenase large subunit [Candidatus Ozemobacteraceae bacterium]